ncbi:hypothetical protein [Chromobacterium haemolyticum]|uniref:hypothetical protein n=1 Tax=Chromobacterium haemolyticum TaxID=394935 RepID=UPI0009DA795B|nr:hypothetical protein [Chromobacterium haemolyticum]OQS37892.1 hypothetical protein B0T40_07150 [Chromobacterium haemolyticum]OQS44802.1 hypothetical protein B0T39_00710 [Chromobacterium haemolyticum]
MLLTLVVEQQLQETLGNVLGVVQFVDMTRIGVELHADVVVFVAQIDVVAEEIMGEVGIVAAGGDGDFPLVYRRHEASLAAVRSCSKSAALREALHGEYKLKMLMCHSYTPLFRLFSPCLALAREIVNRLKDEWARRAWRYFPRRMLAQLNIK